MASLKKKIQIETSTILSSPSVLSLIKSSSSSARGTTRTSRRTTRLAARAAQQEAHAQQCLHRICSPVTAFKVLDPDPGAVDGGHVLGLRFEVMSRGQFLRPYYVMLNRPFPGSEALRVHRHTIPPAVPLSGLAARYLPAPARGEGEGGKRQDLDRFVRTVRREIVRYHNRLGSSADLRRSIIISQGEDETQLDEDDIVDVGIADIEAKQIKLSWADDRSGRLVMDDNGKVVKLMVFNADGGRDWDTTTKLSKDGGEHIEDIVNTLLAYSKG